MDCDDDSLRGIKAVALMDKLYNSGKNIPIDRARVPREVTQHFFNNQGLVMNMVKLSLQ